MTRDRILMTGGDLTGLSNLLAVPCSFRKC